MKNGDAEATRVVALTAGEQVNVSYVAADSRPVTQPTSLTLRSPAAREFRVLRSPIPGPRTSAVANPARPA